MSETGKEKKIEPSRILNLPVSKKIELAHMAGRRVRAVLITDSNKQVREAVLTSPRITEVEIVAIAKSQKLDDDLLRRIAANVQWLKNYQVRRALVNNPRTPLPIALKLVPTLLDADLKQLAKNAEVSEDLIAAAESTAAERGTDRRAPVKTQAPIAEKKAKSRFQEIQDMPVPDKIKLAMTGDKEARSILIKDSNKQVQEAVLDSPRISDMEIVAVANSRNVPDEMLRKIAVNRQWMKNYQVRLGLVNNPKTPLPMGLKIIGTLMLADLKRLSKNKGVSNVLSSAAQRFVMRKGVK
jgi:predicted nucleotidyltransferase